MLLILRLGLFHFNKYKFKHNFRDFVNPPCPCNLEPETTSHYSLHYHLFQTEQRTLINDIKEIDEHFETNQKNDLDQIL